MCRWLNRAARCVALCYDATLAYKTRKTAVCFSALHSAPAFPHSRCPSLCRLHSVDTHPRAVAPSGSPPSPSLSLASPLHFSAAAPMSLHSLQRKLQALQYPAMESLFGAAATGATAAAAAAAPAASSGGAVTVVSLSSAPLRTLVAWLESSKIRFLPVADRAALQAISAPDPSWTQAFTSYLSALGCSRPFSASMSGEQLAVVLDWMCAQAVAAEYADHAGEFNSLSKMWFVGGGTGEAAEDSASSSRAAAQPLDCGSTPQIRAAFESEVAALAQLFQLPSFPEQQAAMIRVVRKRVEECIVAEAAQAQQTTTATAASNKTAAAAGAGAGRAAAASAASSSSKPPVAPKAPRAQRSVRAPEPVAVPTTREEVFAALDQLETGFPNTGGERAEEEKAPPRDGALCFVWSRSSHVAALCRRCVLSDVLVERAATVLRLLFLHDLRASQNLANELMMLAQECQWDGGAARGRHAARWRALT